MIDLFRSARRNRRVKSPALRRFLAAGLLLLGAFAAHGQDVPGPESPAPEVLRLSPKDAVELAIQNNLGLENQRVALDTKKRKSDLVWNQFLPTLSVNGVLSRDNWASSTSVTAPIFRDGSGIHGTDPSTGMSGTFYPPTSVDGYFVSDPITMPQWRAVGQFSANLNFSFALIAGIEAIHSDYRAGLVTFERARLQLERDVRKAYNQILSLEAGAALMQTSYDSAVRQVAIAEANYNAGLAPRLTLLQAQVQVENLKPSISEIENGLKAAKANFAYTLGLPYTTDFILEPLEEGDFFIPLDTAELISKAASGKPDILELQEMIVYLQNARAAQVLQLYTPYLNLSWNMGTAFKKDPFGDNWFNADDWMGTGSFSITLGISLNTLFPFTKEGQGLMDVDNQLTTMNINLAQAIRGTELEIFTKINSLENIRTTAEAQKAAVELAELSYRLTEEAYQAGLQDFQAVLSASQALEQAKNQLQTQQFNYLNDLIDLEYAVGVPFGTLSSRL